MPIRTEFRQFYGREWKTVVRPRILVRAGGKFSGGAVFGPELFGYAGGAKCEQCGKPDRTHVETVYGAPSGKPLMLWRSAGSGWRDHNGETPECFPSEMLPRKSIVSRYVILTVAHLNHTPGDDRDENLKALCSWCHLNYDKLQHKKTRSERRDKSRPILALVQGCKPISIEMTEAAK